MTDEKTDKILEEKIDNVTLDYLSTFFIWILVAVMVYMSFIVLDKYVWFSFFLIIESGILVWISLH